MSVCDRRNQYVVGCLLLIAAVGVGNGGISCWNRLSELVGALLDNRLGSRSSYRWSLSLSLSHWFMSVSVPVLLSVSVSLSLSHQFVSESVLSVSVSLSLCQCRCCQCRTD